MILPVDPNDIPAPDVGVDVEAFFAGPSVRDPARKGGLSEFCAANDLHYEYRPQQETMAQAVAEAIADQTHLIVEAGTGVGKSYAYLVPTILAAREMGKKVVISTYTIALQEQLMAKDIPFLQRSLGVDFKAALVKGQGNYLCRRRLALALRLGKDLFDGGEYGQLELLEEWSRRTQEGSLQDMRRQPRPEVWEMVCAEDGTCTGHGDHSDCFLGKARRAIGEADVLVVNHHLFCTDLSIRLAGGGFLPDYVVAVIDEAHQLEGAASSHLGVRLTPRSFERWCRRLYVEQTRKGLLATTEAGPLALEVKGLKGQVDHLFQALVTLTGLSDIQTQVTIEEEITIDTTVPMRVQRLIDGLHALGERMEDGDLRNEVMAAERRGQGLLAALQSWLQQPSDTDVYWMEWEGHKRRRPVLMSAPLEVGPLLTASLYDKTPTVVMTSATLSIGAKLDYFANRIGMVPEECEMRSVGSPFHFEEQMRVFVPKNLAGPEMGQRFVEDSARAVKVFVERSRGDAFVLFTSKAHMQAVAALCRAWLADHGYPLLIQGEGIPRSEMLDLFRKKKRSVLFGLDSFWMGVDVPGDALRNVIITKLPFAVPDAPLVKARYDLIRERGGEPFWEYAVPEAVLKFRQGVGRLIRTATDEGIVVILDNRILRKRYGRMFFQSLPPAPVEEIDV